GGEPSLPTDAPGPPAPAVPDRQAASDSGPRNTDNVTNVTSPTFDVTPAEATATVQLLRKPTGAPVGSYVVVRTRTGPGAIQDQGPVPDGVYDYASRQIDLAGNIGPISALLQVTIDTTNPLAPGVPDLQAASASGIRSTD